MIAIALHGGAGNIQRTALSPQREAGYLNALEEVLNESYAMLQKGDSAVNVVAAAVRALENNPLFNAGKGAVYTADGTHEMDAAIMDGFTGKAGAVAGVKRIKNPVMLAKAVMERTSHVLLVGEGAEKFASRQTDIETVDGAYFDDALRLSQWLQVREQQKVQIDHSSNKFGTVGAVALDKNGNLAAATSTGGMINKLPGRVGDSPIIGAGTFAANTTTAISCTGHGEFFMRSPAAFHIHCLMLYKKLSLQEACNFVVMEELKAIGGEGGLIAVDRQGNICLPFNTTAMFRAAQNSTGYRIAAVY